MGILERVMQMQKEGYSDQEIIDSLQEQGFSPRQIEDSLGQAQVKNAVAEEEEFYPPAPQQDEYMPQTQEIGEQEMYAPQQQYQEYYPQENYQGYETNAADNTIEIAEQVFQEKIKAIQNQTNKSIEFQTIAKTQIENISERLKRIEVVFDKMQMAILDKVGAYGRDLNAMKKEVTMIEDSFEKLPGHYQIPQTGHEPEKRKRKTSRKRKKKG